MNLKDHLFKRNFHHVREYHKITRSSWKWFIYSSELDKYRCLKCGYQTLFKVNLKTHICSSDQQNKIDFVKTYNCENCDFETSSCLVLGKHVYCDCKNVISNCDQKLSESCGNNDESEENIEEIDKMDKNETMEIEWYRGYCFYKTELERDLRKHIEEEHLSMERSNILSKSNNDTHTTKEIKWFKCKKCTFHSKASSNLKRHILAKHTTAEKIKWFKCENCLFKSKYKGSLETHILLKHTALEKINWFKCKNCSYKCKVKCSLNKHIISKHTAPENIKWFKCNNCSYQSKKKNNLKSHILSQHTAPEKIKWFKCENCDYKCKLKMYLTQHILRKHDTLAKM